MVADPDPTCPPERENYFNEIKIAKPDKRIVSHSAFKGRLKTSRKLPLSAAAYRISTCGTKNRLKWLKLWFANKFRRGGINHGFLGKT